MEKGFKRLILLILVVLSLFGLVLAASDFNPAGDPDRATGSDFTPGNGSNSTNSTNSSTNGLNSVSNVFEIREARILVLPDLKPLEMYQAGESKSVEIQLDLTVEDLDRVDINAQELNAFVQNPALFKVTLFRSNCNRKNSILVCTTQSAFQLRTAQKVLNFPVKLVELVGNGSRQSTNGSVQITLPIPEQNQSNVSNASLLAGRVASNLRIERNGQPVQFVSSKFPRLANIFFDVDGPVKKGTATAPKLLPFTTTVDAACTTGQNGTICSLKDKMVMTKEASGPFPVNLTSPEGVLSGSELQYSVTIDDTQPELVSITTPICSGELCYLKPGVPTNITITLQDSVGTLDQKLVAYKMGSSAAQLVDNCSGFVCTSIFKGSCQGAVQADIAKFKGVPSQDDAGNPIKGKAIPIVCDGAAPNVGELQLNTSSLEELNMSKVEFVLLNDLVTITALVEDDSPVMALADLSFLGGVSSALGTVPAGNSFNRSSGFAPVNSVGSATQSSFVQASSTDASSSTAASTTSSVSSLSAGVNSTVQVPCQFIGGRKQLCVFSFTNTHPGPLRTSLPLTFTDILGNSVVRPVELVILKTEDTRPPDNFKADKVDFSPKRVNIQTVLLFNKRIVTHVTLTPVNSKAKIMTLDVKSCGIGDSGNSSNGTQVSLPAEKISEGKDHLSVVSQVLLPRTLKVEGSNVTITCELSITSRDDRTIYRAPEIEKYSFSVEFYNSATMDFKVQEEIERVQNGSLDDIRKVLSVAGTVNKYAQTACGVVNMLSLVTGVLSGLDSVLGSIPYTQPAGEAINGVTNVLTKTTAGIVNGPVGEVCRFLQCDSEINHVITKYLENLPGMNYVNQFASTVGGATPPDVSRTGSQGGGNQQRASGGRPAAPPAAGTGKVVLDMSRVTGRANTGSQVSGPASQRPCLTCHSSYSVDYPSVTTQGLNRVQVKELVDFVRSVQREEVVAQRTSSATPAADTPKFTGPPAPAEATPELVGPPAPPAESCPADATGSCASEAPVQEGPMQTCASDGTSRPAGTCPTNAGAQGGLPDHPGTEGNTKERTPAFLAYYRPHNSLIVSVMSLCLPGIVYNLEKWAAVDCEYLRCLKFDVPGGFPPQECQRDHSYQKCKFIVGEIFNAIPYTAVYQGVMQEVGNVLSNPWAMITWVVGLFPCDPSTSPASGFCRIPQAVNFINKILGVISNTRQIISQFNELKSNFDQESFCDTVINTPLPAYLQVPPDIGDPNYNGYIPDVGKANGDGTLTTAQGHTLVRDSSSCADDAADATAEMCLARTGTSSVPSAAPSASQNTQDLRFREGTVVYKSGRANRANRDTTDQEIQLSDSRNQQQRELAKAEQRLANTEKQGNRAKPGDLQKAQTDVQTRKANLAKADEELKIVNQDSVRRITASERRAQDQAEANRKQAAERQDKAAQELRKAELALMQAQQEGGRSPEELANLERAVGLRTQAFETESEGLRNTDAQSKKAEESTKLAEEEAQKKVDAGPLTPEGHFTYAQFRAAMASARNAYYVSSVSFPDFDWFGYTSYVDRFLNNAIFNLQGWAESQICIDRQGTFRRGSMGSQAVLVKDPDMNVLIPGAHVEGDGNEQSRIKESDPIIYDYVVTAGVRIFRGSGLRFDVAAYSGSEEKILKSVALNESPSSFAAAGKGAFTFNTTKVFDKVCIKFKDNPRDFFEVVRVDDQNRLCNFVTIQGRSREGVLNNR